MHTHEPEARTCMLAEGSHTSENHNQESHKKYKNHLKHLKQARKTHQDTMQQKTERR